MHQPPTDYRRNSLIFPWLEKRTHNNSLAKISPRCAIILLMSQKLLAQVDLLENYTLTPGGTPVAEVYGQPASLLNTIVPILFIVAGVVLVLFIFAAGFGMVMNPDNKKNVEEGKKKLGFAIAGFILLFASYWIIQIIEQVTGVPILNSGV